MAKIALTNLKAVIGNELLSHITIVIEDGMIRNINPEIVTDNHTIDCQGGILTSGMIDLHIHGANGFDMMDGSINSIHEVSSFLAKTGCTGFLPTSVTSSLSELTQFIHNVKAAIGREPGAKILGIHLEGPYLNRDKKGMQNEAFLCNPNIDEIRRILDMAEGLVKMVTIAPELPGGMEMVSYLSKMGIIVSIAHSNANYEQAKTAFHLGASHVTHCFNAMRPIHHREPGVVIAAFEEPHVSCQAIVDNVHLHPAIVRLMHRNLGANRMALITDAMQGMGMEDGEYHFGGHVVHVLDGIARLTDGTLASSTITMEQSLKIAVGDGIPLMDAVRMASSTPAAILELNQTGVIAEGATADLVLLDDELNLKWTMIDGIMQN